MKQVNIQQEAVLLGKVTALIYRLGPVNWCGIKAFPSFFPPRLSLSFLFPSSLPSGKYPRPSKCIFGRWANSRKFSFSTVLWDTDWRRRRRRGRSQSQHDQCGKWNVSLLHGSAGQHHRKQWVGGKESKGKKLSCLIYSIISNRRIQIYEVSQLLNFLIQWWKKYLDPLLK